MKIAQHIAKTPLFSLQMMKQELNKIYELAGFNHSVAYAEEMFNICRHQMQVKTDFASDINEKGLKHTIETKYEE